MNEKDPCVPLGKDPGAPKIYTVNLFPLSSKGLKAFDQVTDIWGKGSDEIFAGILYSNSELTLIPKDAKCHCGSLVKVGVYEEQLISNVLAKAKIKVVPVGP